MNSIKSNIINKTQIYSLSSINMKNVSYFVESIKILQSIYMEQILPFQIIDYTNSVLYLEFITKDIEPIDELIDKISINNILEISVEKLLQLLTKEENIPKNKNYKIEIIEEDEFLIQNNTLKKKMENNKKLKSLLIDNQFYFVTFHPLEQSIIQTINITVEEYLKQQKDSIIFWNCINIIIIIK